MLNHPVFAGEKGVLTIAGTTYRAVSVRVLEPPTRQGSGGDDGADADGRQGGQGGQGGGRRRAGRAERKGRPDRKKGASKFRELPVEAMADWSQQSGSVWLSVTLREVRTPHRDNAIEAMRAISIDGSLQLLHRLHHQRSCNRNRLPRHMRFLDHRVGFAGDSPGCLSGKVPRSTEHRPAPRCAPPS